MTNRTPATPSRQASARGGSSSAAPRATEIAASETGGGFQQSFLHLRGKTPTEAAGAANRLTICGTAAEGSASDYANARDSGSLPGSIPGPVPAVSPHSEATRAGQEKKEAFHSSFIMEPQAWSPGASTKEVNEALPVNDTPAKWGSMEIAAFTAAQMRKDA